MTDTEELAAEFEAQRPYLHAIAFRMLGSHADADDAVQEAWLRLARTGGGAIEDLRGWLTTVTGRICLDVLRRRGVRAERPLEISVGIPRDAAHHGDPHADRPGPPGPGRSLLGLVTTGEKSRASRSGPQAFRPEDRRRRGFRWQGDQVDEPTAPVLTRLQRSLSQGQGSRFRYRRIRRPERSRHRPMSRYWYHRARNERRLPL